MATVERNGTAHRKGQAKPKAHKLPQHHKESEQALLGSCIRENELIDRLTLKPAEFYFAAHQQIFAAIRALRQQGKPVDVVTLAELLNDRQQVEDVGGYGYLGELWDAAPTAANAAYYAESVHRHYRYRQLEFLGQKALSLARDPTDDPERLLQEFFEDVAAIVTPAAKEGTRALDEIDAADLVAQGVDEHLDYLPFLGQDGYMVRGWSHLLASYPRCGKTELMAACCREWLSMGEEVLYLTEEPRSMWASRLARTPTAWKGLRLVFALGEPTARLLDRLSSGHETIVIIDTIRGLGVVSGDENDNSRIAAELTPWIKAARDSHKTLHALHHMRKGAGDHGEGIAGGHAFLGAVDIALELKRPDTSGNRRAIKGYARLFEPQELLYERLENGAMHALGRPDLVSLADVGRRAREVLNGEWMKTAEILDALDDPKPSDEQLRRALTAEAKGGRVEREPPIGDGPVKGKRQRWRAAQT